MVSAMVINGGSSVFLILTSHRLRRVQQTRRHRRRKPRRHAPIRRNIRPRTLQTAPILTNSRTTPVIVLDAPSLRETPPPHQTAETVKSRVITLHILLSAERQATVVTPHPAGTTLPIFRHIRYLPLIVRDAASGMFRQIHQDTFGMRRHPLPVHGNHAANVD